MYTYEESRVSLIGLFGYKGSRKNKSLLPRVNLSGHDSLDSYEWSLLSLFGKKNILLFKQNMNMILLKKYLIKLRYCNFTKILSYTSTIFNVELGFWSFFLKLNIF